MGSKTDNSIMYSYFFSFTGIIYTEYLQVNVYKILRAIESFHSLPYKIFLLKYLSCFARCKYVTR